MSMEIESDKHGSKPSEAAGGIVEGKPHPFDPQTDARLLMSEFTHRINNELSSAISMIAIAAAHSTSCQVREVLAEVQDRLQACARVHRILQMPQDLTSVDVATYLKQLCQAISRSKLDFRKIDLLFVERPFLMSCDRCWRLGLIVSELITNSARHAFGEGGGSIRVELVPLRSVVECRVTDNGKSESSAGSGRGRPIVEGLVRSLGGSIMQRFGRCGSISVVRIPCDADAVGARSCSEEISASVPDHADAGSLP
jgi:two-component sensor histidine kinase